MSTPTVAQQGYTIREGATTGSGGAQFAYIEGVVDSQAIMAAYEYATPERDGWLMVTYSDIAAAVGVPCPGSFHVPDIDTARQWVAYVTALYAAGAGRDPECSCDAEDPGPSKIDPISGRELNPRRSPNYSGADAVSRFLRGGAEAAL